jgi:hypothetical protein
LKVICRSRLKLGNACYHSVQNLLSSSLLSNQLKISVYTVDPWLTNSIRSRGLVVSQDHFSNKK